MDDWSWGGWLVMTVTMIAFWTLVAWVIVVAIRASRAPTQRAPDPERTLAERFAVGEINEDEYHRRLEALRSAANTTRRVAEDA
jgi:putative membrane protein